jgi:hypothetical protein
MLPSIKSEPIPETQEGPVTVVVAHNYKDVVLDDDKDVLIEFYAPWVCSTLYMNSYLVWPLQDSCSQIRTTRVRLCQTFQ